MVDTPAVADAFLHDTVGHRMAVYVPTCRPDDTADGVRRALVGKRFDTAAEIAVCEMAEGLRSRLLGVIPIEVLLAAAPDVLARSLMVRDPVTVTPDTDQERAAWLASRHHRSSLAVVDDAHRFLGLVPAARLVTVLRAEHDEDLARLGGYLRSREASVHALEERLWVRLAHRMPWLVLGLLGSALAAAVVQGFEGALDQEVRLAFFIPGMLYMASAVGTQTVALVIRGLSVGVDIRRVYVLEALTGLAIGLGLAVVIVPFTWWVMGSVDLALTLGVALIATCSMATVVAIALPWLMQRWGRDPAFGSGPLATVIQDVLSLVLYFLAAWIILL